jgi:hypothetical protein
MLLEKKGVNAIFCKSLGRSHFGQKRSNFSHPSPLFSADALHRPQKAGSAD